MPVSRSQRAGLETLVVSSAHAEAEICPARGALITRFRSGDDEVLFLDETTFADPGKSVRGGVPILFPLAGPPAAGSPLKQHGFARTSAWQAEVQGDRVELALRSSPATRALFPHDFRISYTLELVATRLELRWQIFNAGDAPMPLHFGLHPYFAVPLATKSSARVDLHATKAWNNRTRTLGPPSLELGGDELDMHLLDPQSHRTTLHRGDGSQLALEWSKTFDTVVVWTLPGQPFVCVEPWSGPSEPARAALGLERQQLPGRQTAAFAFTVGQ
jgi:galactose mutarotase-like enzyme